MTDAELALARSQVKELRAGPTLTAYGVAVARSLESLIVERDALRAEINAVIDHMPNDVVVRSCEGGGPENICGTLAISVSKLAKERDALAAKVQRMPHMCRDDHEEVWHAGSDDERCPICKVRDDQEKRIAELEAALKDACERMTRARMILTDNNPRWDCNWGMLDASNLTPLLANTKGA